MNFEGKQNTKNQGTSQPEASQQQLATVNEWRQVLSEEEELKELDEVQLATVVGGARVVRSVVTERGVGGVGRRGQLGGEEKKGGVSEEWEEYPS